MHETAFAKLNLALHVRARQADGYHRIETLFAFVDAGDGLRGETARDVSLEVHGPFAAETGTAEDNLVLRAAQALRAHYGVSEGARLSLDKRLPVAAGLGGGSADAAAALRLLTRLWELPDDTAQLRKLAAVLGADVPACVDSRLARGEGTGTALTPVEDKSLDQVAVLLVNPGVPLSTPQVFARWDGSDRGPLGTGAALDAALAGRNDLEPPACGIVPEIAAVLDALGGCDGLLLARMSGSGATCFALFGEEAARDEAADRLAGDHSGWWQLAARLRASEDPHD
jgi:4-diphosphocytidyl-2-C-methyl-D-erythritol kinase